MNTLIRSFWAVSLAFSIFIIGCANATDPVATENVTSSEDNAMIDGEFSTLFATASAQGDVSNEMAANKKDNGIAGKKDKCDLLPSCATVDYDSLTQKITIDYGTQNCLCSDGLNRRGKVIINSTGAWKSIGSSITVTLIDYYVQDMKVTGTKTVNINSNNSFSITVTGASIETPTGTISWNASRTIIQTKGFLTKNTTADDEFEIIGNASGINRKGVGFSVSISNANPLLKRLSCTQKEFVSGEVTILNDKGDTLIVNYDPDNSKGCNKNAIVTINGKTYNIRLR